MNPIPTEDLARADYYAVLSRLFFAPPDETLLATLADAGNVAEQGALPVAWNALCAAAGATSAQSAREEYDALFVAIGKPRVVLYASWHLTGFMMEKPLAKLREDLAELGLARTGDILEPEDHFAALMDIMRHLLLDASRTETQRLALQQRFFSSHVSTWCEKLCDAIEEQPEARLYRGVAGFVRAFLEVEKIALKIC
ncbi:MAG: molecular chaperone TorD family protein [Proteobacteria bacterium]|nr:molecular chaperone TorD family protein [Pseudomonadota bacterium]